MKAGNDLIMPGNPDQSQKIVDAVKNATLDIRLLDRNVTKILQIILQSPEFKKYPYSSRPDLATHARIVREAAAAGMVLARNENNTLPLIIAKKVALFGNASYDLIAGGTGSGDVNKPYTISLAKGLANGGYSIDPRLAGDYDQYITAAKAAQPKGIMTILNPPPPPAEMALSPDRIAQQAAEADIAVLTIGRNAGEGHDRQLANDYYLNDAEKEMIRNIAEAFHARNKKLVVVLNIGGPIEIASWRNQTDAILLAWQPGMEGGNSITDILSGKVNPSGKLATSFPMDYKDVPSADNFPGIEFKDKAKKGFFGMPLIPAEVIYKEGIYVGYRYYNTFGVPTALPFGYGLSYTHFRYSDLHVASSGSKAVNISLDVTNDGKAAGREVAQIYVSAPAGHLDKPSEELKAFAKTTLLQPGETQTLHFVLNARDLASFDASSSAWITDAGKYTVRAGASSEDIRQTAPFNWSQTTVAEKVNAGLAPPQTISELKK